jgi:hypothetical protein
VQPDLLVPANPRTELNESNAVKIRMGVSVTTRVGSGMFGLCGHFGLYGQFGPCLGQYLRERTVSIGSVYGKIIYEWGKDPSECQHVSGEGLKRPILVLESVSRVPHSTGFCRSSRHQNIELEIYKLDDWTPLSVSHSSLLCGVGKTS